MGFTNKVKTKDGTEYDIQDARIPEILAENEGKVIAVEDGALVFKDAPSGIKLYNHNYILSMGTSFNIISTKGTALTSDDSRYIISGRGYVPYDNAPTRAPLCTGISGGGGTKFINVYILKSDGTLDSTTVEVTNVTPTITEL